MCYIFVLKFLTGLLPVMVKHTAEANSSHFQCHLSSRDSSLHIAYPDTRGAFLLI